MCRAKNLGQMQTEMSEPGFKTVVDKYDIDNKVCVY